MNISTKGRYALSYLTDLAAKSGENPVSIKDSAKNCDISEKYLEQIVGILCKNNIVKGIRGPHGGYVLSTSPSACTVGKVLRIMEGNMCVAPCLEDAGKWCERSAYCSNVILWKKIDDALNNVIDNITLADMCKWRNA